MEIKILGIGCPKCNTLEKVVREVVSQLDIKADISKEEDIMKIMEYGIMRTPGLVINGEVKMSGRVPTVSELEKILTT